MSKDITLFVNEEIHVFSHEPSLQELFLDIEIGSTPGVAIAVNNHVLPKSQWDSYQLKDHDKILIIQATQGG